MTTHLDGTAEELLLLGIVNRNNTWYFDAPLPRRWHRCSAWTVSEDVSRCACGAVQMPSFQGDWIERNSRRREGR